MNLRSKSYDNAMSLGKMPQIKVKIVDNIDEKRKKRRKKGGKKRKNRPKKHYHWAVGDWNYSGGYGDGGNGGGGE